MRWPTRPNGGGPRRSPSSTAPRPTSSRNVSHEFRTPLTLIMGPVAELRAAPAVAADPRSRQELDVIHRNALRLGKLVNSLLDFSRLQAGRVEAHFEPVDLAAYTAELASVFRSAVDRAGIDYVVDVAPLPEPVYVDRDMWEKIVLNLLSNALKFTFEGRITVALRAQERTVVLTVADTGTGVPAEEVPRLFERFHRVERAKARSGEGSGIGLAVVRELIGLHGGTITVDSALAPGVDVPRSCCRWDTITCRPTGSHPTPTERGPAAVEPFVAEALRWLPDGEPELSRRAGRRRPGAGARRRRQRRHARVPDPAAPAALHGAGGERRRRGARGRSGRPTRPRRQRRDDARPRRDGAAGGGARRPPDRPRPGPAVVGACRAGGGGRGPRGGGRRLPRQAVLRGGAARPRGCAPAAGPGAPRGRGAVHRHRRPRPGADLGGRPGRGAGVRERGLAAVHRPHRRRDGRGLAGRPAPAGPAALPRRGGRRDGGGPGLGGRVPPPPRGRRVPVAAGASRADRAHGGVGRQLHRHQRALPGVRAPDPARALRCGAGE